MGKSKKSKKTKHTTKSGKKGKSKNDSDSNSNADSKELSRSERRRQKRRELKMQRKEEAKSVREDYKRKENILDGLSTQIRTSLECDLVKCCNLKKNTYSFCATLFEFLAAFLPKASPDYQTQIAFLHKHLTNDFEDLQYNICCHSVYLKFYLGSLKIYNYIRHFLKDIKPMIDALAKNNVHNVKDLETLECKGLIKDTCILHGTRTVDMYDIFGEDTVYSSETMLTIIQFIMLLDYFGRNVLSEILRNLEDIEQMIEYQKKRFELVDEGHFDKLDELDEEYEELFDNIDVERAWLGSDTRKEYGTRLKEAETDRIDLGGALETMKAMPCSRPVSEPDLMGPAIYSWNNMVENGVVPVDVVDFINKFEESRGRMNIQQKDVEKLRELLQGILQKSVKQKHLNAVDVAIDRVVTKVQHTNMRTFMYAIRNLKSEYSQQVLQGLIGDVVEEMGKELGDDEIGTMGDVGKMMVTGAKESDTDFGNMLGGFMEVFGAPTLDEEMEEDLKREEELERSNRGKKKTSSNSSDESSDDETSEDIEIISSIRLDTDDESVLLLIDLYESQMANGDKSAAEQTFKRIERRRAK